MKLETKYSCGDKVWAYTEQPELLTIGQVRITHTDSNGINDGFVLPSCDVAMDNYKPQLGRTEEYMCVETGIGSGTIWSLSRLHPSRAECEAANQELIESKRKEKEAAVARANRALLAQEASLRSQLERIEQIKSSACNTETA